MWLEKNRKYIVLALKKIKYLQFIQFLKSYKEQFHDPEHNEWAIQMPFVFFFSFLIQKRQVILEQNKAAGIKYGIIFKQKTFPGIVW